MSLLTFSAMKCAYAKISTLSKIKSNVFNAIPKDLFLTLKNSPTSVQANTCLNFESKAVDLCNAGPNHSR